MAVRQALLSCPPAALVALFPQGLGFQGQTPCRGQGGASPSAPRETGNPPNSVTQPCLQPCILSSVKELLPSASLWPPFLPLRPELRQGDYQVAFTIKGKSVFILRMEFLSMVLLTGVGLIIHSNSGFFEEEQ